WNCQVFWQKKWGILIKRESESLNFTGLEIPRDYYCKRRRMGVDLCICNWYNYRCKLLINMLQIKIINMGKEYRFFV
ncbi:hypothetical protein HMPREF1548_04821, partial [Clostridium sp. KLE 1755]|uniref:hypothetical protein n=1 Tax=Clostridium sp. KLE 1755 TaxID=1226325 RepID=UPI000396E3A4